MCVWGWMGCPDGANLNQTKTAAPTPGPNPTHNHPTHSLTPPLVQTLTLTALSQVYGAFLAEAQQSILPFDALYRGRTIFPTRDDGSIFLSLAAFREHLLAYTLKEVS